MLAAAVFLCAVALARASSILVVVPTPSRSHQMAFRPLWEELARLGHDVTLLTTDPLRDASEPRLREIDLGATYEIAERHDVFGHLVAGEKGFAELGRIVADAIVEAQEFQMSTPEVRRLLEDPSVRFDLVVVEAQSPFMLAWAWRFRCPSVAVSSLDAPMTFRDAVGDVAHPTLEPDFNLDVADMGLRDRLVSVAYAVGYRRAIARGFDRHRAQALRFFGDALPPFEVLLRNVSLLLHNTHPLTHRPRACAPNSVAVGGGMHIRPPEPLPEEIRTFLDGAENGAVYFSLGGNIKSSLLPDGFADALLRVFSGLPYRFVLKMDGALRGVPANVLVTKWAPQQDVLRHPSLGLFVTHGGLQSIQETLHSGVPILGIPFYGDAFANVNRAVQLGYARKLKLSDLTEARLRREIVAIVENSSYKLRAGELMEAYRHEDVPSLARAVHRIEHVLRFGGAPYLRSDLADAPAWKYYALDVVATLAAALCAALAILCCALRTARRCCMGVGKVHVE